MKSSFNRASLATLLIYLVLYNIVHATDVPVGSTTPAGTSTEAVSPIAVPSPTTTKTQETASVHYGLNVSTSWTHALYLNWTLSDSQTNVTYRVSIADPVTGYALVDNKTQKNYVWIDTEHLRSCKRYIVDVDAFADSHTLAETKVEIYKNDPPNAPVDIVVKRENMTIVSWNDTSDCPANKFDVAVNMSAGVQNKTVQGQMNETFEIPPGAKIHDVHVRGINGYGVSNIASWNGLVEYSVEYDFSIVDIQWHDQQLHVRWQDKAFDTRARYSVQLRNATWALISETNTTELFVNLDEDKVKFCETFVVTVSKLLTLKVFDVTGGTSFHIDAEPTAPKHVQLAGKDNRTLTWLASKSCNAINYTVLLYGANGTILVEHTSNLNFSVPTNVNMTDVVQIAVQASNSYGHSAEVFASNWEVIAIDEDAEEPVIPPARFLTFANALSMAAKLLLNLRNQTLEFASYLQPK